jgi:hypothetical protein
MPKYASISFPNPYREPIPYHNSQNQFNENGSKPSIMNGYRLYVDVVIELRDENGILTNGNYDTVSYEQLFNGNSAGVQQVQFAGTSTTILYQVLKEEYSYDNSSYYDVRIVGDVIPKNGTYSPPTYCDAKISTVIIDRKESNAGSKDGQITIQGTSSAGSLEYSIDGINWQANSTFTGLSGGGYVAYLRDARSCPASLTFTVDTMSNLLVADPATALPGGNVSRWSAAFNPIVFTYQRRDFEVTGITAQPYTNNTIVSVNAAVSVTSNNNTVSVKVEDMVYLKTSAYDGVYRVISVDVYDNTLMLDVPFKEGSSTGFININKLRPYYQVNTKIEYQDKITGQVKTITCTHRPNQSGVTKADISSFLQSLLRAKDDSTFTQTNYRDDNLSACYSVSYAEVWQDVATGKDTVHPYISAGNPYYVMFAARQLGDANGGNMAAYVPFKTVDGPSRRARWVTDFAEPAYSSGYPFDIGFIYGEDLAGLDLYCETTALDINRQPVKGGVESTYLLNEDKSFLLNTDGSKLTIMRQPVTSEPTTQGLAKQIGLNRLRINSNFSSQVRYFNISLKYADGDGTIHTVTQTQTIQVDDAGDEQSVYLRWIGLSGSWNYYRFVYNQEVTLDVQNAVIVKNHILDWANQDAMEDVISKSAGVKMKVMAEDLSVADIKGLQSIKYSPKVQMLVNKNPVKWQTVVLNTATFAEYETRNGQAPFSITFNLPALNVQTQ